MHNFTLKPALQMVRPEHQLLCMDDDPCLLCMSVDACCVCFYAVGTCNCGVVVVCVGTSSSGGGSGGVCVRAHVCM